MSCQVSACVLASTASTVTSAGAVPLKAHHVAGAALAGALFTTTSLAGTPTAPAMSAPTTSTRTVLSTPDATPPGVDPVVHLVATVTAQGGGLVGGVVEFAIGHRHTVALVPLDDNGVAEADVTLPDPRDRGIKAFYLGDGSYAKSHSDRLFITPQPPFDPNIRTYWEPLKTRADGSVVYLIGFLLGYQHRPIVPPGGAVTADSGFDCFGKFRPFAYLWKCKGLATPPAAVTVSYTGDENFLSGSAVVHLQ